MKNINTHQIRLTASERRFAAEMEIIKRMTLSQLLSLEKSRMPVGI
jgi:hypothetical protein